MLVELAIGDAYGAGFEYAPEAFVREQNTLADYVQHPGHKILPGRYTDDTQMSLAITEALLSGQPWTKELLAEHFVNAFNRDPREGYAKRFYEFLQTVKTGTDFLARIDPVSDKSGAAMRAGPLGVLPNFAEVVSKTTLQAKVTHDTMDGINSALAAAFCVHYCLYQLGPLEEIGQFIERHVIGSWSAPWVGPVGAKGWMSVRAAITVLSRASKMSEMLKACVDFTGDVDTVAAVALAAGSVCVAIEQDLPPVLFDHLENGPYGRDHLAALDKQLMALARP
jgi:ADP-ribosylglycohydrolase